MGLDAGVNGMWKHMGSYSGYMRWRQAIANASGFELDEMDGFGGCREWDEDMPFQLVLNHSDCDGEYAIEELPNLLQELTDIKKLDVDDYDQTERFIRLCKHAIDVEMPIVFA